MIERFYTPRPILLIILFCITASVKQVRSSTDHTEQGGLKMYYIMKETLDGLHDSIYRKEVGQEPA